MELFLQDDEMSTSIDAHKKVIFELHKVCCKKKSTNDKHARERRGGTRGATCTCLHSSKNLLLPRFHRWCSEYNVIISFLVVIDIYDWLKVSSRQPGSSSTYITRTYCGTYFKIFVSQSFIFGSLVHLVDTFSANMRFIFGSLDLLGVTFSAKMRWSTKQIVADALNIMR